ncbi:MAG: isopenicillin N synthase family oxygenase [Chitinophagales bacterium]|nr:isopenicillin N synthase family oxygenase [Chitinophagales bacterium]
MAVTSIPAVDLSKFANGNEEQRKEFIAELGKAWKDVGFVTVKNHGVPDEYINAFYTQVKRFFEFDTKTKLNYEDAENAGQRGYTSFGREHAKGFDAPDLKEFWQMGQEVTDGDEIRKEYPSNIVVDLLPDFEEIGRKLYTAFEKSGGLLLQAIALYLDLDENYFDANVHNGNSILRAIHYPPIQGEPKSSIRAEQHEDINLITLLAGASAEGLQVKDKDGNWVSVNAPEGHLVINVGDMLQRLTNNVLRSTTHRVVNPPREMWHTSRYSIPFFLHPRSNMDLTCLDICITEDNPLSYQPITSGEYLDERLREIGLKK